MGHSRNESVCAAWNNCINKLFIKNNSLKNGSEKKNRPKTKVTNVPEQLTKTKLTKRDPGVWTGRAWNISFFIQFHA